MASRRPLTLASGQSQEITDTDYLLASYYQFGSGGPLLKGNSGRIDFRDSADSTYTSLGAGSILLFSGANAGTLSWTPTAARSIEFPDSSGTVGVLDSSGQLPVTTLFINSQIVLTGQSGRMNIRNSANNNFSSIACNTVLVSGATGSGSVNLSLGSGSGNFTATIPMETGTILTTASTANGYLLDAAPDRGSLSGSIALDVTKSGAKVTVTGNVTFSFSGSITTGYVKGFLLQIVNGGAYAITWPSSIKWASATAPTLTTSGTDYLTLYTIDGGTTWSGGVSAKDAR